MLSAMIFRSLIAKTTARKNGCDDACHDPSRNPTGWPPPGNPPHNRAHDYEAGQEKYQSKKERSEGDDCEPCKCRTHPAAHCGLVAAEIGIARRAYHHCDGEQYPKRYAREEDCSDIADSLWPLLIGEATARRRVHGSSSLTWARLQQKWSHTTGECRNWVMSRKAHSE